MQTRLLASFSPSEFWGYWHSLPEERWTLLTRSLWATDTWSPEEPQSNFLCCWAPLLFLSSQSLVKVWISKSILIIYVECFPSEPLP